MSNFYISVTDLEWFSYLRDVVKSNTVNFWTPTPWNMGIKPGEYFYFMLKSPIRKIGGYGIFKSQENMTINKAWQKFSEINGVGSKKQFFNKIDSYLAKNTEFKVAEQHEIGCIELENVVFFSDDKLISLADHNVNFSPAIVKYKKYQGIMLEFQPEIPALEPVKRNREYHLYPEALRDEIIFRYLFDKTTSHRKLDKLILKFDPDDSKGWQSMGILHHIGIKDKHKGVLENYSIQDAINILRQQDYIHFKKIIESLSRYVKLETVSKGELIDLLNSIDDDIDIYDTEGRKRVYQSIQYERSLKNRKKAIKIHGTRCLVCGFDFEKCYGELGKGFIEVHHIEAVSTGGERVVNPETGLIPVCPNCHRMIHRKKNEQLDIESLKKVILENKRD